MRMVQVQSQVTIQFINAHVHFFTNIRHTLHTDKRVGGSFALVCREYTRWKLKYRRVTQPPTDVITRVIEFIKIKIKRGYVILKNEGAASGRAQSLCRAQYRFRVRRGAVRGRENIGPKYLLDEKVTSFQLSVSTLFASSLCIDRSAPFARRYSPL